MLGWRDDLPVPRPGPGEVLVRVAATSVNNTDVNTRIGWYSKSVRGATAGARTRADDGGWAGAIAFPRIQGADLAGRVVAVGDGVATDRIGARVVCRAMYRPDGGGPFDLDPRGSERDGAFAEYATARSVDAPTVRDDGISDAALGALPCAYSTAERMLDRIDLGAERVLVTGASDGVGLAAVQPAALRGAEVVAGAGAGKGRAVAAAGAGRVIARDAALPEVDVVVDAVAGPRWPDLLAALRRGGRYVASGAIAGPIVDLDVRDLDLRDLTLKGSTAQPDHVLPNLLRMLESGRRRPAIAATYPSREMKSAPATFAEKAHVGKIVLTA